MNVSQLFLQFACARFQLVLLTILICVFQSKWKESGFLIPFYYISDFHSDGHSNVYLTFSNFGFANITKFFDRACFWITLLFWETAIQMVLLTEDVLLMGDSTYSRAHHNAIPCSDLYL